MASAANYAAGARLRRCGDATATHYRAQTTLQSTAVKGKTSGVQRISVPQRSFHGRSLILAMGLSLLLGAAAPADASQWAATFPSLAEERASKPYAAEELADYPGFPYLTEEDEGRSLRTAAQLAADEEAPSPVEEDFTPFTLGEEYSSEPQPEGRLEDAEAGTADGGSDNDGLAPEPALPAVVSGSETYEHLLESMAEPYAIASASDVYDDVLEGMSKMPTPGDETVEDRYESLAELPVALSGSEEDEDANKNVTERPVAASENKVRGSVTTGFANFLEVASGLLPVLTKPVTGAANAGDIGDELVNVQGGGFVDLAGEAEGVVEDIAMIENSGPEEATPVPDLHHENAEVLYEAAVVPLDDESAATLNEASVQNQITSMSPENAPSSQVRSSDTQPSNEDHGAPANEELHEIAFTDPSRGGNQQRLKSKSRQETETRQSGDTEENQSRQTGNRRDYTPASHVEEEKMTRTRGRTDSLRGSAKTSSIEKHREMKAGVRWKNMLQIAAALGLAVAGAEGGLRYMNGVIDKRESSVSDGPQAAGVNSNTRAAAGNSGK